MLFNSIEFALFLPIVFLLYWFVFDYALRRCHLFFLRDICTPKSNIKTQSHAKNEQHASFFVKYVKKQASNEKNGCIFAYKEYNLMKSKNKSEIASAAGVSLRTLRNWLQNPKAQHILQKYGHKQTDRILCPGAVRELCEYFDIQFD